MTAYAELAVTTNFSFLRGAAHPQEMVETADELGLKAIGIADRNSFAGVVRAYEKWKKIRDQRSAEAGKSKEEIAEKHLIRLLVGTRLVTTDGFEAITYPTDRKAYGRLCRLITQGNKLLDGKKGECLLSFEDILAASEGQIFVAIPPDEMSATFEARLATLAHMAPGRCFLAGCYRYHGDERRRLGLLNELGARLGAPMVAVNDVHYHVPKRRALADVLTCIREKCTVQEAGFRLARNAERHLKAAEEMARLFADYPEAIARTIEIANACHFDLGKLQNEYPDEPVPPGKTPQQHLEDLTWAGAERRYPDGIPKKVITRVKEEFAIIAKLDFARYFLTVHDVVVYARSIGILCQGRGSAANSAVCYCLGITEINPETSQSLFARFVSENRGEPPDIDVDFEHERREEVIQYVYSRYGREHAAICATVVHYRSRRAVREVGKALGLTPDITAAIAKTVWGSHDDGLPDEHIRQAGLDASNAAIRQTILLARQLLGFPRHLSQHVGGFVLTRERLDETVPIGNGAMKDRTFIEWDKDDIDTLGLMKVDVLALGMLSCLRRGIDLLKTHYGEDYTLDTLPKEDRKTYDMLSRADSVGVFQVESRAQMSMLPRLKPKTFYDLVIEVAIVRPGPIQGNMVHPYLRQRERDPETIEYPHPSPEHGDRDELKNVLKRTLGVPLFQEQAMQIAITAAKFTPDEADGLRRAMATFRHTGNVPLFREKFINRMVARGYDPKFVENCFGQIEGFGEYGFPESHAASFALLVYASAWIKCHYPAVFCAAILNSQPMGFYQPAQLVRDAREHGVEVREADVNSSKWDCTLEPAQEGSRHRYAVRLGFRQIQGLQKEELDRLIKTRGNGYASIERLAAVAGVSRFTIERLAAADAFRSLGLDRRKALWVARRLDSIGLRTGKTPKSSTKPDSRLPLLAPHMSDDLFPEPEVTLTAMPLSEHVAEDYVATGLSLKEHPIRFFRDELTQLGAIRNVDHRKDDLPQNSLVTVAGLVLMRQMPGTAKGVVFATLEDETGIANIVIWPKVFERHRRLVMTSRFLAVHGRLQRAGLVVHVVAEEFVDLTSQLCRLRDGDITLPDARMLSSKQSELPLIKSRDFH
jgi:error-prone DNA polymerase